MVGIWMTLRPLHPPTPRSTHPPARDRGQGWSSAADTRYQ